MPSSNPSVERLTLDEITAKSDYILIISVNKVTSHKEEGRVSTLVMFSIEQSIKGEPKEDLVIRIPGGAANGQAVWVEDTARFQAGERAVVFLRKGVTGLKVVGGFQGKVSIDSNNMIGGRLPLTVLIDQIKAILATQQAVPK